MGLAKLLQSNLRSAVPRFEGFATCVRMHQADTAGICESWCHEKVLDSMVSMDGYHLVRRDRGKGKGGGLSLYIHQRFPYQIWTDLHEEHLESFWVTIRMPKMPVEYNHISIWLFYHPPNARGHDPMITHINFAMDCIQRAHPYSDFLIMGGFNRLPDNFLCSRNHMKQLVKTPTRNTAVLDKIFTNMKTLYTDAQVTAPVGTADHNIVLCHPQLPSDYDYGKAVLVNRRTMGQNERAMFTIELRSVRWEDLYHMGTCEQQFNRFQDTISGLLERHFPVKLAKVHEKDKPWITEKFRCAVRGRERAWVACRMAD